jgi:hypothetical protein
LARFSFSDVDARFGFSERARVRLASASLHPGVFQNRIDVTLRKARPFCGHTRKIAGKTTMSKFLVLSAILAVASAFTASPSVLHSVGEKGVSNVFSGSSHSNRRATIVMDGKANGT